MKTSPAGRNRDFSRGVPFTQFLMPDGRRQFVWIEGLGPDVETKAQAIVLAGYVFECEMLSDYHTVSFTISDDGHDYTIVVCENGEQVPELISKMILDFVIGETGEAQEIH